MHLDKHVVKMIIEYAQLMSTHRVLDGEEYYDKTKKRKTYQTLEVTGQRDGVDAIQSITRESS